MEKCSEKSVEIRHYPKRKINYDKKYEGIRIVKKVMIWWTKARGHRAYKVLNNSLSYEVIAFGDNDPQIIGN